MNLVVLKPFRDELKVLEGTFLTFHNEKYDVSYLFWQFFFWKLPNPQAPKGPPKNFDASKSRSILQHRVTQIFLRSWEC